MAAEVIDTREPRDGEPFCENFTDDNGAEVDGEAVHPSAAEPGRAEPPAGAASSPESSGSLRVPLAAAASVLRRSTRAHMH